MLGTSINRSSAALSGERTALPFLASRFRADVSRLPQWRMQKFPRWGLPNSLRVISKLVKHFSASALSVQGLLYWIIANVGALRGNFGSIKESLKSSKQPQDRQKRNSSCELQKYYLILTKTCSVCVCVRVIYELCNRLMRSGQVWCEAGLRDSPLQFCINDQCRFKLVARSSVTTIAAKGFHTELEQAGQSRRWRQ